MGSAMQPQSSARIILRSGAEVGMMRTKRVMIGSSSFTTTEYFASCVSFGPLSSCNNNTMVCSYAINETHLSQPGKVLFFTGNLLSSCKFETIYKSFSLSRNEKRNWKPPSGRSQENEML